MFSAAPGQSNFDISWDQGSTFLFRDHRQSAKANGLNLEAILFDLNAKDLQLIQTRHKAKLLQICQCQDLELFQLGGTFFDHIVLKENQPVLGRERL